MREMLWPDAYIVRVTIPSKTRESQQAGWLADGDYPAVALEFSPNYVTFAGRVWVLTNRGLECLELSNKLTTVEEYYSVRLLTRKQAKRERVSN